MSLYYECHITIEPVFGKELKDFKALCGLFDFRVADLLMKKRKIDTPERSKYDTFCTSRGETYVELRDRMLGLLTELKKNYFVIYRYKIEDTLVDSRIADIYRF